ncbi:putative uncharacterized protein DDB_G0282133 [Saccostrea cucullata]|uniref:putative uncharacterized protein DDB_G0282133 n=1 Tax=Saccostrea cuccullata TaxID=36930 RepID=UPI002ED0AE4D
MFSLVTSVLLVAVLVDGAPTSTMVTATTSSRQELNLDLEKNNLTTLNKSKDTEDSYSVNASVTIEHQDDEFNNTTDDEPREQPKMMKNGSVRIKKINAYRFKQIQNFLKKIRKLRSMLKVRILNNSTENSNGTMHVIPKSVLRNMLTKYKQYKKQGNPPVKASNTSESSSVNATYSTNKKSDNNSSLLLNFVRFFESESPIIRKRISQNTKGELISEDDLEELIEERDENEEGKDDDDYDISDFIIRMLDEKQEPENADWMYTPENQAEPRHEADNIEWYFTPERGMEALPLQESGNLKWNFVPNSHVEPLHELKSLDWNSAPENRIESHLESLNMDWNSTPESYAESVVQDKANDNEEPRALVTDHNYYYHKSSPETGNQEANVVDSAGNVEDGKLESLLWKDFFSFQIPDKITRRRDVPSHDPERKLSSPHYNEKQTELDGTYDYEDEDSSEREEDNDYQYKDTPDYTNEFKEKESKSKVSDKETYDKVSKNDKATYGKSVSFKDLKYNEEGDSSESGEDSDYQYDDSPDYVDDYEDRSSKAKVPNKKTYGNNQANNKGSYIKPFSVKKLRHGEESDSFESGEDTDYQFEDTDYVNDYEDRSSKVQVPQKKTYGNSQANNKGSYIKPFSVKKLRHGEESDSFESGEDTDYQFEDTDYVNDYEDRSSKVLVPKKKTYGNSQANNKGSYIKPFSVKKLRHGEESDSFESGEDTDYQFEDTDYVNDYEDRSLKVQVPNKKTYGRKPVSNKGRYIAPFSVKDIRHGEEGDSFESEEDFDYQYEDTPDYVDQYKDRSSKFNPVKGKLYGGDSTLKTLSTVAAYNGKSYINYGESREVDDYIDESKESFSAEGIWNTKRLGAKDASVFSDKVRDAYRKSTRKRYFTDKIGYDSSGSEEYDSSEETLSPHHNHNKDINYDKSESKEFVDYSSEDTSSSHQKHNMDYDSSGSEEYDDNSSEGISPLQHKKDSASRSRSSSISNEHDLDSSSNEKGSVEIGHNTRHMWEDDSSESNSQEYYYSDEDYYSSSEEQLPVAVKVNTPINKVNHPTTNKVNPSPKNNVNHYRNFFDKHAWESEHHNRYQEESRNFNKYNDDDNTIDYVPPKLQIDHQVIYEPTTPVPTFPPFVYRKHEPPTPPTTPVPTFPPFVYRTHVPPTPPPPPTNPPKPIIHRTYLAPSPPPPPTVPPQPIIPYPTPPPTSPPSPPVIHYIPPTPTTPPPPPPPPRTIVLKTYIPTAPTTPRPAPPPPRTIVHKTYIPPTPTTPPPLPPQTYIPPIPTTPPPPPVPEVQKLQILRTPIFPPTFPPPTNPPPTLPPKIPPPKTEPIPKLQILRTPIIPPPRPEPRPRLQISIIPINLPPVPKPEPTPKVYIPNKPIPPPVPRQNQHYLFHMLKPKKTKKVSTYDAIEKEIMNVDLQKAWTNSYKQNVNKGYYKKNSYDKKQTYGYGKNSYGYGYQNIVPRNSYDKKTGYGYGMNTRNSYDKKTGYGYGMNTRNSYDKKTGYGYGMNTRNSYDKKIGYGYGMNTRNSYDKKTGYGYGMNNRNSYDKKTGYGHSYRTTPNLSYKRNNGYGYRKTYGNKYSNGPSYGKRFSPHLSLRPFILPYPTSHNIIHHQVNKHFMGLQPLLPFHVQPVLFGSSALHQNHISQNGLQKNNNQYFKRRTSKY